MLRDAGAVRFWGGKGQAQGLPLPERFEETVTAAQEGVRGQAQGLPLPERFEETVTAAQEGVRGQAQGLPLPERFEETVTATQEEVRGQAQGLPLPSFCVGGDGSVASRGLGICTPFLDRTLG